MIIFSASGQKKKERTEKFFKKIEKELQISLDYTKSPGFAVAVVEKDKIIYSKGFGYKDYEKKLPVTPNTMFAIGSCTKAFTSSILGILSDEGKLELSDSPIKYIPDLRFYNDDMNNSIVINDLMCHRTGMPRHDFSWYLFPSKSKSDLVKRIEYQEPSADLRAVWQYNNFMFLTQGLIAEKITGKSWEENVKEKLFEPLKMHNSTLDINGLKNADDRAIGYELKNDSIINKMSYYDISGMSPAGSINSSVNEMSNWLIAWINGGKFEGESIIPTGYGQQAISSQMVINAALPAGKHTDIFMGTYGFGWMMKSYKGHYMVEHGGNIDGFSASTCFFPSDSIGIVILTNQNASALPTLVRRIIADNLLELTVDDWNEEFIKNKEKASEQLKKAGESKTSNQKPGTKLSHSLEDYTGKFSHPGYGEMKLQIERDSLFVILPVKKLWLKHYHYDIFQPFEVYDYGIDPDEESGLFFNFHTGDTGDIEAVKLKLDPTLDVINFKREIVEIEVSENELDKFVGTYDIAGTELKVYIKNKTTLYFFVAGQPEYEQLATGKNKFSFKSVEGFGLEFIENEKGEITGVIVIQPNGNFEAVKK